MAPKPMEAVTHPNVLPLLEEGVRSVRRAREAIQIEAAAIPWILLLKKSWTKEEEREKERLEKASAIIPKPSKDFLPILSQRMPKGRVTRRWTKGYAAKTKPKRVGERWNSEALRGTVGITIP